MDKTNTQRAIQLLIDLDDVEPQVWRRILVSEYIDLSELRELIQIVFDWQNYHLHEFAIHGVRFGDLECDDCEGDLRDEKEVALHELGLTEGESFGYLYDFGDSWHHLIRVERIISVDTRMKLNRCLAGQRACPPENVGGSGGYTEFLEAVADHGNSEHRRLLEWAGGELDPEVFDLEDANDRLAERERAWRARSWGLPLGPEGTADGRVRMPVVRAAPSVAGHQRTAYDLPLRRDVLSFMSYLRDHRVTGTTSTGCLPLKAVADVSATFVDPPVLDTKIRDQVFRCRSEKDVFQLYFVHRLANGAGLIYGGPGFRWRLTQKGQNFFSESALIQVFTLLHAWWYRVNWLAATTFDVFGDSLSPAVPRAALNLLSENRAGQYVEYASFIDRLIEVLGWMAEEGEPGDMRRSIRREMEKMLVRPLEDFGVLVTEQVTDRWPEGTGVFERTTITSFTLTDLGGVLIDGL